MVETRKAKQTIKAKERNYRQFSPSGIKEIILKIDGRTVLLTTTDKFFEDNYRRDVFELLQGDILYALIGNYSVILTRGWEDTDSETYSTLMDFLEDNLISNVSLYLGRKKGLRYALIPHFNKNLIGELLIMTGEFGVNNGIHLYVVNKALLLAEPKEIDIKQLLDEQQYDFYITPNGDYNGLEIVINKWECWESFILPTIRKIVAQYELKLSVVDVNQVIVQDIE